MTGARAASRVCDSILIADSWGISTNGSGPLSRDHTSCAGNELTSRCPVLHSPPFDRGEAERQRGAIPDGKSGRDRSGVYTDKSVGRLLNVFRVETLQRYLRYLQLTAFQRARTRPTAKSIIIGAPTRRLFFEALSNRVFFSRSPD